MCTKRYFRKYEEGFVCDDKTIKRMDKPPDSLAKRQSVYAGDVLHEFFGLPGKYVGPMANEYPNVTGSLPRVDSSYLAEIGDKLFVINREDESGPVNNVTMEKINRYRVNLEYATELPVMSVLTVDKSPSFSQNATELSPTLTFSPWVIVYNDLNPIQRLICLNIKIINNEVLTCVEAMNLVMIPRMFSKCHEIVLEYLCTLFDDVKIDVEEFKFELILEMRCIIHKYAKTLDDIVRLEGVIGLQKAMTAMEFQKQFIFEDGVLKGMEEAFKIALKIKENFGIDKALEMTNFSRSELENGKMNINSTTPAYGGRGL